MNTQADLTNKELDEQFKGDWWEGKSSFDIVTTQLRTDILLVPFHVYRHALEEELHRPVYTHEMGDREALRDELIGGRDAPTNREIIQKLQAKAKGGRLMVLEVNDAEELY